MVRPDGFDSAACAFALVSNGVNSGFPDDSEPAIYVIGFHDMQYGMMKWRKQIGIQWIRVFHTTLFMG